MRVIQCLWPRFQAVDRQMVVLPNSFVGVWAWQRNWSIAVQVQIFGVLNLGLDCFLILPAFARYSRVLTIVLCEITNQSLKNNGFHKIADLLYESNDSKLVLVCYHSSLFHSSHALFSFFTFG